MNIKYSTYQEWVYEMYKKARYWANVFPYSHKWNKKLKKYTFLLRKIEQDYDV